MEPATTSPQKIHSLEIPSGSLFRTSFQISFQEIFHFVIRSPWRVFVRLRSHSHYGISLSIFFVGRVPHPDNITKTIKNQDTYFILTAVIPTPPVPSVFSIVKILYVPSSVVTFVVVT